MHSEDLTVRISQATLDALRTRPVDTIDTPALFNEATPLPLLPEPPYERLGLLDEGGMGAVHLLRDTRLRRHVAMKVLHAHHADDAAIRGRFVAEAQLTAQLDHPNIVPVYTMELDDQGSLAYTMKLVQGETFFAHMWRSIVARHDNPEVPDERSLDRLLGHFLKVCDAVSYAHARNVVHRDLKPGNIMVGTHGEVYVMDWGLARAREASPELDLELPAQRTLAGHVLGTPAYMAPEQAAGRIDAIGPATDQYALGLVLYELVTGRLARPEDAVVAKTLVVAARADLPPIEAVSPYETVSPGMVALIQRATAKEPEDRYPSVQDLARELRRLRSAAPTPTGSRLRRWVARNTDLVVYVLVSLVATLALVSAGAVTAGVLGVEVYRAAAEAREAKLTDFLGQVGGRADEIDRAFSALEGQLEAIAGAGAMLLEHGERDRDELVRSPADFRDLERRPPDTAMSTSYRRLISTEWPDVVIAPGVPRDTVASELEQLVPIRIAMRRAHLETRMELDRLNEPQAEAAWRDVPGPLRWTIFATPAGVYLEMPGADWFAEDYEPRERPWYTVGIGSQRPRWGRPFQEASSGTLLIPCSMEVRSEGTVLGVASLSVSFDYLIDRYLAFDHPAVRETYLVDDQGRIMVRSSEVSRRERTTELNEHWETPDFPDPALAPALRDGGVIRSDDGRTLLFHYPLSASGWSYVVEVDADLAGR